MPTRLRPVRTCLFIGSLMGCNQLLGLERAECVPTGIVNAGSAGVAVANDSTSSSTTAGTNDSLASGSAIAGSAGSGWGLRSGGAWGTDTSQGSSAGATFSAGVPAKGIASSSAAGTAPAGSGNSTSSQTGTAAAGAFPIGPEIASNGKCDRNAYRCEGSRLTWRTSTDSGFVVCASDLLCDAQNCECDLCRADSKTCLDSNTTDACNSSGQAHIYEDCQSPTPYCSAGDCVACLADDDCRSPDDAADCVVSVCNAEHRCAQQSATAGTTCMHGEAAGMCDGLGHCGACVPDQQRCGPAGTPERCTVNGTSGGQWVAGAPCVSPTPFCEAGLCEPPPSCRDMTERCGPNADHCCLSPAVYGSTYTMGSDDGEWSLPSEQPAHPTTVGPFRLDAFEVSVGRFRRFVSAFDGPPAEGAGANPHRKESTGWQSNWSSHLPHSAADLVKWLDAQPSTSTWTHDPGGRENYPINHMNWYLAFAFCVYDGGWLPSEAEWELAASGSDPQHKNFYPWGGSPLVSFDTSYATFELSCLPNCTTVQAFRPVGSAPKGKGAFGQYDLAGNVAEWAFDFFDASYYAQFAGVGGCQNCVNTTPSPTGTPERRTTRGSHAVAEAAELRVTAREPTSPSSNPATIGIRCARPE